MLLIISSLAFAQSRSRCAASAIDETAAAAATMLADMKTADASCRPLVVGSSALAAATNCNDLANAVAGRTGLEGMDFVTAQQEAELGLVASIPPHEWKDAVLVGIGSVNTKLGYKADSGSRRPRWVTARCH